MTERAEVVVITGASAGVGRACARQWARPGARVGLIARGRDGLEAARKEIEAGGGEALVLPLDVSDAEAVEQAASAVEDAFGPIDVWVNNAMTSVFSPVKEMTAADYRRVTEVTYLGYVHGTLAALHRMLPRNRGAIVQVGSALSYRAIPLQSAYCAAKHAIKGFTESLRCELLHDGSQVRLTMVQMPALNTPQFTWAKSRMLHAAMPVPPIYDPRVAARAVYWAAHHRRREWWVGGATVLAILGERVLPGLLDRYLGRTAYEAQQTNALETARDDNLLRPLPGDHGMTGPFAQRAHARSVQWWINSHRMQICATVVLVLASALWLQGGYG